MTFQSKKIRFTRINRDSFQIKQKWRGLTFLIIFPLVFLLFFIKLGEQETIKQAWWISLYIPFYGYYLFQCFLRKKMICTADQLLLINNFLGIKWTKKIQRGKIRQIRITTCEEDPNLGDIISMNLKIVTSTKSKLLFYDILPEDANKIRQLLESWANLAT